MVRRVLMLAAATAMFVGLAAVPASAGPGIEVGPDDFQFDGTNPCTGEIHTTFYDDKYSKVRFNQGAIDFQQKANGPDSVVGYTSDGYELVAAAQTIQVKEKNTYTVTTPILFRHPETRSMYRVKQVAVYDIRDFDFSTGTGEWIVRVRTFESICIRP